MSRENVRVLGEGIFAFSNCITCGVTYSVPQAVWNEQRRNGGFHFCPNGHQQGWAKENSETEVLRRERDKLRQRLAQKDDEIRAERDEREAAERRARAARGQVTKLKKRAANGVCPCCSRHFTNLERHMSAKHPEFSSTDNVVALAEKRA